MKNDYTWDKKRLRILLGCSPRKLKEAISKTAAEWALVKDKKIEDMHHQRVSNHKIASTLGFSTGTVDGVVKELPKITDTGNFRHPGEPESGDDFSSRATISVGENGVLRGVPQERKEDPEVQRVLEELNRQEVERVVKSNATPIANAQAWMDTFLSMAPEEQAETTAIFTKHTN